MTNEQYVDALTCTQIREHYCDGEWGDVADAATRAGYDCITIQFARNYLVADLEKGTRLRIFRDSDLPSSKD